MSWSLVLDIVLVLVFIGAVVNGWRSGLLRTAAGLLGLIAGAIASYFVMPWVAALVPWPEWRAPAALVSALVLLGLGAWLGAVIGRALRSGAHAVKLGVLDRVLGSIGNLLVTAFVVALVASGVSAMGVPVLSPAVAGSRVLQTLDTVTPAPTRSLLAQLRTAALGEGIPWLVDVLEAPPVAGEPPTGAVDTAVLAEASRSVVRITGNAFECGSNLSGSGFVVASDRVVTNAHVVAGVTEPIVEAPGQPALPGRVVAFDTENDLALIAVDGLAHRAPPDRRTRGRRRRRGRRIPVRRPIRASSGARRSERTAHDLGRRVDIDPRDRDALGRRRPRQLGRAGAHAGRRGRRGRVRPLRHVGPRRVRDSGLDAGAARRSGARARRTRRLGIVRSLKSVVE